MPELPEVENVKNTLCRQVLGKTIQDTKILWTNIIKVPSVPEFKERLKGETIQAIRRRGKFLIFEMDSVSLVSHLRMEGRYGLFSKDDPTDAYTHVFFCFTDGTELRYRDVRKFGTMHLFDKGEESKCPPLSLLGVEPLSKEFTPQKLKKLFANSKRPIKALLLDQSFVAGLGNIYVDEVLFQAGILPQTPASTLSNAALKKLHTFVVSILKEAVEKGGSTIRSYVNAAGEEGGYQLQLYVYGRKGEECRNCGSVIERTIVAGRGTHICFTCQK